MSSSTQTLTYSLFKNLKINISSFSSDAQSSTVDPHIGQDPALWRLQAATINISISQNNNGGAEVYPWLNGTNLGEIHWGAFDNSVMTRSIDVTSQLANDGNEFYIEYHIDIPALLFGSAAIVQFATLTVEWEYIGKGTPPPLQTGGLTLTEILIGVAVALAVAIGVVVVRRKALPR